MGGASTRVPRRPRDFLLCSASLRLCSLHQTFDLFPLLIALPRWFSGFPFPLSAFLCLLLSPLLLQAQSSPQLLPGGRHSVVVPPIPKIPFAQQTIPEAPPINAQEGATEEARLRRILQTMKIGGVSGNSDQKQALLGPLILKPGNTLPKIIKNQIEEIRVVSVSDNLVVLEFLKQDPSSATRELYIPFGINPEVRQFMSGDAAEALTKAGVAAPPELPQAANPPDPVILSILTNSQEAERKRSTNKLMGVVPNAEDKKKTE